MSEEKRDPIFKNNEVVNEWIPSLIPKFLSRDAEADSEARPGVVSPFFSHKADRFTFCDSGRTALVGY
jgi:hypothetical protein